MPAFAQQTTVKDAFLEKWNNSKDYLVKIAQAMPQEKYTYKPTEREMSFEEQLLHIRENSLWLSTTYFTDKKFDRDAIEKEQFKDKEALIVAIEKAFDEVAEIIKGTDPKTFKEEVKFFAGPKSKLQILNLIQDHVTHHRGQIIVYLNLNEIKPPRFVGW